MTHNSQGNNNALQTSYTDENSLTNTNAAALFSGVGGTKTPDAKLATVADFMSRETFDSLETDEIELCGFCQELQDFILDHADARHVPLDFIISPILATASAAMGNGFRVKARGYAPSPLIVWTCLAAPAGTNKSTPSREITQPLREIDRRIRKESELAIAQWEVSEKTDKSKTQTATPKPPYRALLLDDTTREVRQLIMSQNPRGVGMLIDELTAFFERVGRYAKNGDGGETSELLSIWNGDYTTVDRMARKSCVIEHPFIAIHGTVQPALIRETFTERFYQKGAAGRWLVFGDTSVPISTSPSRLPDEGMAEKWSRVLNRIYDDSRTTLEKVTPESYEITPSHDAVALYDLFRNKYVNAINCAENTESLERDVLTKDAYLWRLAAIINLLNRYYGDGLMDANHMTITASEMKTAISIFRYSYTRHRRIIINAKKDGRKVTKTDIIKMMKELSGELGSYSDISKALKVDRGLISRIMGKNDQKKH